jgi:hypothetical protein
MGSLKHPGIYFYPAILSGTECQQGELGIGWITGTPLTSVIPTPNPVFDTSNLLSFDKTFNVFPDSGQIPGGAQLAKDQRLQCN